MGTVSCLVVDVHLESGFFFSLIVGLLVVDVDTIVWVDVQVMDTISAFANLQMYAILVVSFANTYAR